MILDNIKQISSTLSDPDQVRLEYQGIEFMFLFLKGDIKKVHEKLRNARSDARQRGDLQMLHNFNIFTAEVYMVRDRIEGLDDWIEAEDAAAEAIEISKRGVSSSVRSLCQLSTIYIRQGRLEKAKQLYIEAQRKADDSPSFWEEHSLLENKRDLASGQGRWLEALTAAEAVSNRLAKYEMRLQWAFSLVVWAEIHIARGEPVDYERAWALYREALALFEEMEAEFYANIINERLRALRAKSYAVTLAHDKVTRELAQAGRIQESFLPEEIPEISGWEISAILKPARETSGDFYDFIQLPGNRLGIVVADVADKGMAAALYMTTCRTLIRTYAGEHPDEPERVLEKTNRRILVDTHGGLFITVFYGVLDPATGMMTYCNAGHNPPFLFSSEHDADHQVLSRTGMPLGIIEEASWEQGTAAFNSGDVLVAYTDGVTEAQNERDEFYGEARLLEVARSKVGHSAKVLQEALEQDLREFSDKVPQFDDLTILVVKKD